MGERNIKTWKMIIEIIPTSHVKYIRLTAIRSNRKANEDTLVTTCILENKLLKLTIPMDAIRIISALKRINIPANISIIITLFFI